MKFKFLFPHENKIKKVVVKINEKYMLRFRYNFIDWRAVNCTNIQSVVITGMYKGKNFWSNTISFDTLFKAFPPLQRENKRFKEKGFNKKILDQIFKNMNIYQALEKISYEKFKEYIIDEYGSEYI